ncbi:MAG: tetratricopeptide repeat protein [Woeseiaceae bacterium]|nr:tetratricopeptide repeat protein [Woeseiaceae bacterium]
MRAETRIKEAIALQRAGRLEAADEIYTAILGREPAHPAALHYLGLVRFQQGRLDEAERLISESLQQAPDNANAWSDLGMVRVRADAPDK